MPRKQAFSGKQKKQQLQAKKQQKGQSQDFLPTTTVVVRHGGGRVAMKLNRNILFIKWLVLAVLGLIFAGNLISVDEDETSAAFVSKMGAEKGAGDAGGQYTFFESKPVAGRGEVAGRYALMFRPESKAEVEQRKEEARQTIHAVSPEYLECSIEDFFTQQLDFPTRPNWDKSYSKQELESREAKYFSEYLKRIDATYDKSELSYFELNLETWRQFWRVLEMSDILLCIVDARFPALLFPPKLYEYSSKALGKHIILILNKIDLVPAPLVLAWMEYFKTKYPDLEILCFTSYPSYNLHGNANSKSLKGRKRRGKLRMAAEGALELYKVCDKIVSGQVDLNAWKEKIHDEMSAVDLDEEESELKVDKVDTSKPDTGYYEFKKFGDGILTIGCLGQPNVGKSSLINAIMGKKVVSVSKTPGHTKHFQTIFLTANVRLCDCPGLIFPSKVPKALQVLAGSYPIAQLREPYSTVKYLAERLPLPQILHITHPELDEEWSAFDIADGWAQKRGFFTAKAARLDSYRGANHLLRIALEGRICLCLRPPDFTTNEEKWNLDPRIEEIERIQAKSRDGEILSGPVIKLNEEEDFSGSSSEEEFHDTSRKTIRLLHDAKSNEEDESETDEEESQKPGPTIRPMKTKVHNKFALLLDEDD